MRPTTHPRSRPWLAFAKELGAVKTVNAAKDEPSAAVMEITQGGAHVSIDALGIAATCRNSMIETGKLRPGKLVHRRIPLDDAGDVLASMDSFATVGVTVIDRY